MLRKSLYHGSNNSQATVTTDACLTHGSVPAGCPSYLHPILPPTLRRVARYVSRRVRTAQNRGHPDGSGERLLDD